MFKLCKAQLWDSMRNYADLVPVKLMKKKFKHLFKFSGNGSKGMQQMKKH